MTLRRTLDPTFLNDVANDPDVRPSLGGVGLLDLGALVSNPVNVALQSEHGGFVGVALQQLGVYDVHSLFRPVGRGDEATQAMRDGLEFMFLRTPCVELITTVPRGNIAAQALCRLAGFLRQFDDSTGASHWSLSLERWMLTQVDSKAEGERFHDALEAEKVARQSTLPVHGEDDGHDAAVGTVVRLVLAGQPQKAVRTYNRWAAQTGYAPIALVTETPPVIDIVDAIVSVREGTVEVLLCR